MATSSSCMPRPCAKVLFDGPTLQEVLTASENLADHEIRRIYPDKGYVGRDGPKPLRAFHSGQKGCVPGQLIANPGRRTNTTVRSA
jgi:hypothetical protein